MSVRQIIAIEDDPGDLMLLRLALDAIHCPYPLQHYNSGPEALEQLARPDASGQPLAASVALVLVDFSMPLMGGPELVAHLRARPDTRDLPVVILSGSIWDAHEQKALASGANAYVQKSMRFDDFQAVLSRTIARWADAHLRPAGA